MNKLNAYSCKDNGNQDSMYGWAGYSLVDPEQ